MIILIAKTRHRIERCLNIPGVACSTGNNLVVRCKWNLDKASLNNNNLPILQLQGPAYEDQPFSSSKCENPIDVF